MTGCYTSSQGGAKAVYKWHKSWFFYYLRGIFNFWSVGLIPQKRAIWVDWVWRRWIPWSLRLMSLLIQEFNILFFERSLELVCIAGVVLSLLLVLFLVLILVRVHSEQSEVRVLEFWGVTWIIAAGTALDLILDWNWRLNEFILVGLRAHSTLI